VAFSKAFGSDYRLALSGEKHLAIVFAMMENRVGDFKAL